MAPVGEDEDECCLAFNLSELMESPINEAGSLVVEVAAAYIAPAYDPDDPYG